MQEAKRSATPSTLAQPSSAAQPSLVNLDGGQFPWRLWLCNLGNLTRDLLGTGISAVHLQLNQGPTIRLQLTRSDDTAAELALAQRTFKDSTHAYDTELCEH